MARLTAPTPALATIVVACATLTAACAESPPPRPGGFELPSFQGDPSAPANSGGVAEPMVPGNRVENEDADRGQLPAIGAPIVTSGVSTACQVVASGKPDGKLKIGPADLIVDWNDIHQTMAGFGASDKYHEAMDNEQADLLFSVQKGIGLSLLRVAIDPNGDYIGQYANAKQAAARGAAVWATPWSPPADWKDNHSTTNGGHLLAAHYADWAARLAEFAAKLRRHAGVQLAAISPQNEPNYAAKWDSCEYTPKEMVAFIDVLGPRLAALNPRPKLLAPEAASWAPLWDYTTAVLADANAAALVDIFSVHQYQGVEAPRTSARPIWETEFSTFDPALATIDNGLAVAMAIHDAIVIGNVSAWHYWWLVNRNPDNEGLLNRGGVKTKRLYSVGNYSKFVRPGFARIGASGGPEGVVATAFRDCSGKFALVVINKNPVSTSLGIAIKGSTAKSVTPWVTSAALDLAAGAPLDVKASRIEATLPASSVTTFVGTAAEPG